MKRVTKPVGRLNVVQPLLAASAAALLFTAMPAAAVINGDPGDYTGLPGGTNLALVYYQHLIADDVYVDGNKVINNLDLKLDVGVLRGVRFVEAGSWIIDPQFLLPFARQDIGLANQTLSGVGDLTFGATFWPLHDLKTNHHFGITVFATAPTGSKKNQGFAISANRWSLDVQAGYIRSIAPKWTIDLAAQTEVYQDQRDTNVEKEPIFQADAGIRYHVSDTTHIAAQYRQIWGGKEKLNGVTQTGSLNNGTVVLTWASFFAKQWQLQLQYRQDVTVEQGPKVQGLQTRLLYIF